MLVAGSDAVSFTVFESIQLKGMRGEHTKNSFYYTGRFSESLCKKHSVRFLKAVRQRRRILQAIFFFSKGV